MRCLLLLLLVGPIALACSSSSVPSASAEPSPSDAGEPTAADAEVEASSLPTDFRDTARFCSGAPAALPDWLAGGFHSEVVGAANFRIGDGLRWVWVEYACDVSADVTGTVEIAADGKSATLRPPPGKTSFKWPQSVALEDVSAVILRPGPDGSVVGQLDGRGGEEWTWLPGHRCGCRSLATCSCEDAMGVPR